MGNKCLLVDFVKGFNLDPVPPAKTMPLNFIFYQALHRYTCIIT